MREEDEDARFESELCTCYISLQESTMLQQRRDPTFITSNIRLDMWRVLECVLMHARVCAQKVKFGGDDSTCMRGWTPSLGQSP